MLRNEKLLREFIRQQLSADVVEENYITSGYGKRLDAIVWAPIADAFKSIKGSVAKISSAGRYAFETIVGGLLTLFIPFVENKYEEILANEQQRQRELNNKYADVFALVNNSLEEARNVLFMINPGLVLTGKIAKEAPRDALEIASMLTGGFVGLDERKRNAIKKHMNESAQRGRLIKEAEDSEYARKALKVLSDPEVRSLIKNSDIAHTMRRDAINNVQMTLDQFVSYMKKITSAKTAEDLSKLMNDNKVLQAFAEVKEDKDKIEQLTLEQLKTEAKKRAIQTLQAHGKSLAVTGEKNALYELYVEAINKIRSM